jgi:hypothetical protein
MPRYLLLSVVTLGASLAHAQTDSLPAAAAPVPEATPVEKSTSAAESATASVPAASTSRPRFALSLDGHLRVEFSSFTPDRFLFIKTSTPSEPQNQSIGHNDGFGIGDARLNVRGTFGQALYVRLGFDGAVVAYGSKDDPVGTLATGLKDAYLRYTFSPALQLYAGRFKPPFDVEQLTPEEDLLFVHRSLESRGVLRHEGFADDMIGFAPGRQVGVMLASQDASPEMPLAVGYALAITNGNSGDASLNDNDLPAVWMRLQAGSRTSAKANDEEGPTTMGLKSGALAGLSGYYNERTLGVAPNRFRDRVFGAGLDAAVDFLVFDLSGQVLWSQTRYLDQAGADHDNAFGAHVQLGVRILDTGFTPAYRFALYNPRLVDTASLGALVLGDAKNYAHVVHHTVGVRYTPSSLPLVCWAEYTRSLEQEARKVANDRVEAAVQVVFE